jgi:hypothetical protein
MKKALFMILAMSMPMFAQTTITTVTTVQDGCGGKALYCTLAVSDENGGAGQITLDNRVNGTGPLGNLSVSALEFNGSAHGSYRGLGGNPDGSKIHSTGWLAIAAPVTRLAECRFPQAVRLTTTRYLYTYARVAAARPTAGTTQ